MIRTVRVAAIQLRAHDRDDFEPSFEAIVDAAHEAACDADLIVLPEATIPAYILGEAPLDAAARTPLRVPQADAWHGLEKAGGFRFRWTQQARIPWHGVLPEVSPLRLRIAVPFLNQVRDGFAEACAIEVGGQMFAPERRGGELVVETTLDGPVENVVVLHTPEPVTPRALRGAPDDRPLGLAIAVYPWVPAES